MIITVKNINYQLLLRLDIFLNLRLLFWLPGKPGKGGITGGGLGVVSGIVKGAWDVGAPGSKKQIEIFYECVR